VAAATAFVHTAPQLYVARFLLGVAEAGFFPGIIIYLTYWFRAKDQAASVALFTAAIPVSYLIGAPVSTWIMDNVTGLVERLEVDAATGRRSGHPGWRLVLFLPHRQTGAGEVLTPVEKPGSPASWHAQAAAPKPKSTGHMAGDCRFQGAAPIADLLRLSGGQPRLLVLDAQIIASLSGRTTNFEVGLIATVPYCGRDCGNDPLVSPLG